jgi:hypothetical protein
MSNRRAATAAIAILLAAAAALLAMGRAPVCTCGSVELWVGARDSAKTSQMLADWYSLSHVVHGLLFYAGLWLVAGGGPRGGPGGGAPGGGGGGGGKKPPKT